VGVSYNSSIVTNGLVLCLDAGNPRSYPGSGTNWYDVSGINNTTTLVNSPVYNSANLGSIAFDGIDDYGITTANLAPYFSSTATSLFTVVYPTKAGQIISELGASTINAPMWHDANIEISTAGAFYFSVWHGSLTTKVVTSNYAFSNWYYVGWTYNGTTNNSSGTLTAYVNGVHKCCFAQSVYCNVMQFCRAYLVC
jgi:hypothetical protein